MPLIFSTAINYYVAARPFGISGVLKYSNDSPGRYYLNICYTSKTSKGKKRRSSDAEKLLNGVHDNLQIHMTSRTLNNMLSCIIIFVPFKTNG